MHGVAAIPAMRSRPLDDVELVGGHRTDMA